MGWECHPYGTGFGMDTSRQHLKDTLGNPSENGGYGKNLKNDIRRIYGSMVGMSGRGEAYLNMTTIVRLTLIR